MPACDAFGSRLPIDRVQSSPVPPKRAFATSIRDGHQSRSQRLPRRTRKPTLIDPFILARLFSRSTYNPTTGCRLWTGSRSSQGQYGTIWLDGRPQFVHRVAYEAANGSIPAGSIQHESESVEIHHICENRLCIEPNHLEALTRNEHNARHTFQRSAQWMPVAA